MPSEAPTPAPSILFPKRPFLPSSSQKEGTPTSPALKHQAGQQVLPGQGWLGVFWRAFHRTPSHLSAPAWFLPVLSSDPVTHQLLTRLPNSFFIWF